MQSEEAIGELPYSSSEVAKLITLHNLWRVWLLSLDNAVIRHQMLCYAFSDHAL